MPVYAGIGSRTTPSEILLIFSDIAEYLAKQDWTLRSGGAEGADTAFEKGCNRAGGKKEIFLPWKNFNQNHSPLYRPTEQAESIARRFHPAWGRLTQGAALLMIRNTHQVLGKDCNDPVNMIICYTSPHTGGTTQALRIAKEYKIPVYNFYIKQYSIEDILGGRVS